MNCSGHLNCHNFAFWCPLNIHFYFFFICHVISFNFSKTCADTLSLARESLLDKHGDKI